MKWNFARQLKYFEHFAETINRSQFSLWCSVVSIYIRCNGNKNVYYWPMWNLIPFHYIFGSSTYDTNQTKLRNLKCNSIWNMLIKMNFSHNYTNSCQTYSAVHQTIRKYLAILSAHFKQYLLLCTYDWPFSFWTMAALVYGENLSICWRFPMLFLPVSVEPA